MFLPLGADLGVSSGAPNAAAGVSVVGVVFGGTSSMNESTGAPNVADAVENSSFFRGGADLCCSSFAVAKNMLTYI